MKVSVIIPALNEERAIGACLDQFQKADVELIVVDGGSTDRTREIVVTRHGVRLLTSPKAGRATQMNLGSKASTGDVLLYLHADTRLPRDGLEMARASLSDASVAGGRFRLGLSEDDWIFRLIAFFSTLRSQLLGITYGDQAIYVRRSIYDRADGFPERSIFEDSEFCTQVAKLGRFVLLDGKVVSSVRRWKSSGVLQTVLWMWILRFLYICSVSDSRLRELYWR